MRWASSAHDKKNKCSRDYDPTFDPSAVGADNLSLHNFCARVNMGSPKNWVGVILREGAKGLIPGNRALLV